MFHSSSSIRWLAPALLFSMLLSTTVTRAQPHEETGEKKHGWFSLSRPAGKTPEEQMDIARDLLKERKLKKAQKAFRSLVVTWPGSQETPMAQYAYARILDERGKLEDAFDAYQVLMDKYAGRFPDYENVLNRQFEIANIIMKKKRGGWFFGGFQAPERAIPYFESVVKNGPRAPMAAEAQYLVGEAHEKSFEYELAIVAFSATLHRYPLSPFAEKASFARARCLVKISTDYPNDPHAIEEAWAGVMAFLRAYPASGFADEARGMRDELLARRAAKLFEVADYYDRLARRPQVALERYREFVQLYPESPWTAAARERIAILEAQRNETKKEKPTDE